MKSILTQPNNISELIAAMHNRKHANNEAALSYLTELVGPHIRVRYDCTGAKKRVAKAAPYQHLNDATIHRVMLTSDRAKANFSRELVQQCNGLIMRWPSLEILAIPPPMININAKISSVLNAVDRCEGDLAVYPINDGTTVCAYWYEGPETRWGGRATMSEVIEEINSEIESDNDADDGKDETDDGNNAGASADLLYPPIAEKKETRGRWCLGSANGFEVNALKMNKKTYMDALLQVSGIHLADLDKSKCYSIGFRSHDFHPLLADPERAWMIQTVDLSVINRWKRPDGADSSAAPAAENSTDQSAELAEQSNKSPAWADVEDEPVQSKDAPIMLDKPVFVTAGTCAETGLDFQQPVNISSKAINTNIRTALEKFLATRTTLDISINYGYVIRADFAKYGAAANTVIESTLLTRIRRSMYNLKNVDVADVRQYVVLRAFLSFEPHHFTAIYPQYAATFTALRGAFDALCGVIYDRLRGRVSGTRVGGGQTIATNDFPADAITRLADIFTDSISRELPNVSPFDPSCRDLIMSFLIHPQYTNTVYDVLYGDSTKPVRRKKVRADAKPKSAAANRVKTPPELRPRRSEVRRRTARDEKRPKKPSTPKLADFIPAAKQ